MGSFHLADSVTGLAVRANDPVVAVVLRRRQGGFPNPDIFGALAGLSACHAFEPASLPIRGVYDDERGVDPLDGQIGVGLLCAMTGHPNLAAFEAHIRRRGTVQIKNICNDETAHHFGLFVVHQATWDHLTKDACTGIEDDVGAVQAALDVVVQRLQTRASLLGDSAVLDLSSTCLPRPSGDDVDLPFLARCLNKTESGGPFAPVFAHWLQEFSGLISGPSLTPENKAKRDAQLAPLLTGLAEVVALEAALEEVGKAFVPAPILGQQENATAVAKLALLTLEMGVAQLADLAFDQNETARDELNSLVRGDVPQAVEFFEGRLEEVEDCLADLDD